MNSFKDFGIKSDVKGFVGDKIKINKILNREITVEAFKIDKSKFNGDCLHLQISIGETKHVVFTGAKYLQDVILQVPADKFPFKTVIIQENDRYEFT